MYRHIRHMYVSDTRSFVSELGRRSSEMYFFYKLNKIKLMMIKKTMSVNIKNQIEL
jgi:hypothetical protein